MSTPCFLRGIFSLCRLACVVGVGTLAPQPSLVDHGLADTMSLGHLRLCLTITLVELSVLVPGLACPLLPSPRQFGPLHKMSQAPQWCACVYAQELAPAFRPDALIPTLLRTPHAGIVPVGLLGRRGLIHFFGECCVVAILYFIATVSLR